VRDSPRDGRGRSGFRRDAILALSLANLCFFNVWGQLLPAAIEPRNLYHLKGPPAAVHYPVAVAGVLLLASAFLAAAAWARRHGGPWERWVLPAGFAGVLVLPANAVREAVSQQSLWDPLAAAAGPAAAGALLGAATAGAAFGLWRHAGAAIRAARGLVMLAAPLALATGVQCVWALVAPLELGPEQLPAVSAPPPPASGGARVLWVLFDELDQETAFERRPAGLALPSFDRLAAESLRARRALPPSRATIWSIPALLSGRPLGDGPPRRLGPSDLHLGHAADGAPLRWSELPSVFARARADGARTALVGWYHPYCRVLGRDLDRCSWEESSQRWRRPGLRTALRTQAEWLLLSGPGLPRLWRFDGPARRDHRAQHRSLLRRARAVAADPDVDLAFLHLPVPHLPCIWDADRGTFTDRADCGYADNLALADRALGALRSSVARAGLDGRTHWIVTSDHWWHGKEGRAAPLDRRVPVLVRPAGATGGGGARYDAPFGTEILAHLALALLRDEVGDAADVAAWLDARRGDFPPAFPVPAVPAASARGAGDGPRRAAAAPPEAA